MEEENKQKKHWNTDKYHKPPTQFDTGDKAERLVNKLVPFVLHDMELTPSMTDTQKDMIKARMNNIIHVAESIEALAKDGNSVRALYHPDFEYRRKRFMEARGMCFQLTSYLTHVFNYTAQGIDENNEEDKKKRRFNMQKYLDLNNDIDEIAAMLKGLIVSDDKARKKREKPY